MAVSLPPAVAVAVNPGTQMSGPIVVVFPGAPLQMIKKSSCAHANYCPLALVMPLAGLACVDIAAATATVPAGAEENSMLDCDVAANALNLAVCAGTTERQ
jgi:hypothetical protein